MAPERYIWKRSTQCATASHTSIFAVPVLPGFVGVVVDLVRNALAARDRLQIPMPPFTAIVPLAGQVAPGDCH
jgi:hypothetical protein